MENLFTIVIILVGVCVCALYFYGVYLISNQKKTMEKRLTQINGFKATQKLIGIDGDTGMAIDEQREKVCLLDHRGQSLSVRVFSYNYVLSSEIFEDGATVTKTVRSSQLGGALIGGIALGGVGAIIGGLSGKTQTSGKVKGVDLRLTVNDTKKPLHDINFLNFETKKTGIPYKQAIQQARHWHGLMEVLIKRADIEDKATISKNDKPKLSTGSVADELKKLAELRDSGVLSADEFQQQKTRILGVA